LDTARNRLFIAALGNNSIEVIDTASNMHVTSVRGFHEPQGPCGRTGRGRSDREWDSGTLQMLDAATLAKRWTVRIGDDADNVRYDAAARRLYVAAKGGCTPWSQAWAK
jgi:hypothetical protein